MTRWQAVVFDLDDTLYPEADFVRGGFRAAAGWAAAAHGVDGGQAFDELWSAFEAGVRGDAFDRWLRRHGLAADENRLAMIDAYRGHRPELKPYPEVAPALTALRGRARLGVITEGVARVQRAKLEALGLASSLGRVVILGEDERSDWKPSPAPFERWLAGQDLAPDQVIYVGDNPAKDFLGARRAGWVSARVRRPDGLHRRAEPETPQAAPDFEVPDLAALVDRVARGGEG